jgi:hypothetical protein
MSEKGYSVPQSICGTGPHNVVSGQLDEDGREDWAVLCSRGDTSTAIIFWGGSLDSTTRYLPYPDTYMLQGMGDGTMGDSRLIAVETPQDIREHYKVHETVAPGWVVHDALVDAFCEKCGSWLYWRNGTREELLGSD